MDELEKQIGLELNQTLRRVGSRISGFMDNIDTTYYEIVGADGVAVGKAEVTEHVNVKTYKNSTSWKVMDLAGKVIRHL